VELLDARDGMPLPGYTRRDCVKLVRDGIRLAVEWAGRPTLAGIGIPEIKLRFHLFGRAKLYSFTFGDDTPNQCCY